MPPRQRSTGELVKAGEVSVKVNRGSTKVIAASVIVAARPPPAPSALKTLSPCLAVAKKSESPTMPLVLIMTAAKTVSRANALVLPLSASIKLTMRPTSMTVTARTPRARSRHRLPRCGARPPRHGVRRKNHCSNRNQHDECDHEATDLSAPRGCQKNGSEEWNRAGWLGQCAEAVHAPIMSG